MRILAAAVIACVLGCSTAPRALTLADGHRGAPGTMRFAVLPTNALLPVSPDLSGALGRVFGRITRYLSVQGRERRAVEPSHTRELWLASVAEVDESDALAHDFSQAIVVFTRKLSESTAFDALVVPSLVYREARLQNLRVKWDGAVRRIRSGEDEARMVPESFTATVPAVSLHLMIFDASGELIFENYGGIDLAHAFSLEPKTGELVALLRDAVLAESRWLNEGVELAFEPYLPRAALADW